MRDLAMELGFVLWNAVAVAVIIEFSKFSVVAIYGKATRMGRKPPVPEYILVKLCACIGFLITALCTTGWRFPAFVIVGSAIIGCFPFLIAIALAKMT